MIHDRILGYVGIVCAGLLLAACGDDGSTQSRDAASDTGGDAESDAGNDAGMVPRRCDLPAGWPTIDSVLSMAEALPDTGDVTRLVTTPRGLHWLGDGGRTLYRLGTDGAPEQIAMTDMSGSLDLVANDVGVAWLWGDSVWGLLLDANASATELAPDISLAGRPLFMDGASVYFDVAFGEIGLTRIALTGGSLEKLPASAPDVLAVHDGYAYYPELRFAGDNLIRIPVGGGAPEQVAEGLDLNGAQIVFDGNLIYVVGTASLIRRAEIGGESRGVPVIRLAAGSQSLGNNTVKRLILDGERLIFADRFGTVGWGRTDGTGVIEMSPTDCANILVHPDQGVGVPGAPIDIALDDEFLYLLVFSGSARIGKLHRIARPMVGL